jgi:hypothetical protein
LSARLNLDILLKTKGLLMPVSNFLIDHDSLIKILAASVYPDGLSLKMMHNVGRSLLSIEHKINNDATLESCVYSLMSRRVIVVSKGWEDDLNEFAAFAKNYRGENVANLFISNFFQVTIPSEDINIIIRVIR